MMVFLHVHIFHADWNMQDMLWGSRMWWLCIRDGYWPDVQSVCGLFTDLCRRQTNYSCFGWKCCSLFAFCDRSLRWCDADDLDCVIFLWEKTHKVLDIYQLDIRWWWCGLKSHIIITGLMMGFYGSWLDIGRWGIRVAAELDRRPLHIYSTMWTNFGTDGSDRG